MGAFANVKIGLSDILDRRAISMLEEKVARARSSSERIALVAHFVRANLRARDPAPLMSHAANSLRQHPFVRIRLFAQKLGISERHLSRRFHAIFGAGPKEFARLCRLEKVLAARTAGLDWASLSYACGFTDQAHMINDSRAILGAPPEQVLAPLRADRAGRADESGGSAPTPVFIW